MHGSWDMGRFEHIILYKCIVLVSDMETHQLTDSLSPKTADAETEGMCGLALTELFAARG